MDGWANGRVVLQEPLARRRPFDAYPRTHDGLGLTPLLPLAVFAAAGVVLGVLVVQVALIVLVVLVILRVLVKHKTLSYRDTSFWPPRPLYHGSNLLS